MHVSTFAKVFYSIQSIQERSAIQKIDRQSKGGCQFGPKGAIYISRPSEWDIKTVIAWPMLVCVVEIIGLTFGKGENGHGYSDPFPIYSRCRIYVLYLRPWFLVISQRTRKSSPLGCGHYQYLFLWIYVTTSWNTTESMQTKYLAEYFRCTIPSMDFISSVVVLFGFTVSPFVMVFNHILHRDACYSGIVKL